MRIVASDISKGAKGRLLAFIAAVSCGALMALDSSAQPAPPNDNFTNAQSILGPSGSVAGSNVNATSEPSEPAHALNPAAASIWYKWTAPLTGTIEFDTSGSVDLSGNDLDTVMGVYTGTDLASLVEVTSNDDDPSGGVTSRVDFPVTSGTDYYIAIDGYLGLNGNTVLNWKASGNAGTFKFATHLDSGVYIYSETETSPFWTIVSPTVGALVTVTRVGGFTGRVSVDYAVGNTIYTNTYLTNYSGTNIFMTNITGGITTYTNILITNIFTQNTFENNDHGVDSAATAVVNTYNSSIGITNINGTNTTVFTNLGCGPNTNLCLNITGPIVTNSDTNTYTNTFQTNVFCYSDPLVTVRVPSAIDGQDYASDSGTLTFDDFEMSKNFYVKIKPSFGPSIPDCIGINPTITLTLTNPQVDPLESPDIVPPTVDPILGNATINVLDIFVAPDKQDCSTNTIFNFEKSTFRVNEHDGTISIRVFRTGSLKGAATVQYTIDGIDHNNNTFPLQAGSDYALPDVDFSVVTGTLSWGDTEGGFARSGQWRTITIPIVNDSTVEFNEDFEVELLKPTAADSSIVPVLGYINTASVTILFDGDLGAEQPAGAADRNHNKSLWSDSYPPFNPVPGANGTVYSIAVQSDGKSVIGGNFTALNSLPINRIARMNANGLPDFGFNPGSGANRFISTVAIDSNGRIMIGGDFTSFNGTNRYHIARLNADGSLDATFKPGFGADSTVWALALQPDGKVVIGGDFTSVNGTNRNSIARLNDDGSVDTTFDPGSGANDSVFSLAVQASGAIVIGGQFSNVNGTARNGIARLNSDGSLDTGFNPGTGTDGNVYSIASQPDNKVIIGGAFSQINLQNRKSIARLNADGSLDTGFDPGSGANDTVYSVVLQPDGTVLLGGIFTSVNQTRRIGIARLFATGPVDTSFMDTAYNQFAGLINHYHNPVAVNPLDYPTVNTRNYIFAIALESSGNVMVGGGFSQVGGGYNRADRLNRSNVAQLIGNSTPGPGNVQFLNSSYTVDENGFYLYVSLTRINGSLGPISVTFTTNTPPAGPGAASGTDFGLSPQFSNPTWISGWLTCNIGCLWMISDGLFGPNYLTQPVAVSSADVVLTIANNTIIDGNRLANLSLFYPNGNDIFFLGGENIPLGPALGRAAAPMTIVDDDVKPGILGFSSTNYTVNENGITADIIVLRTNGSSGIVTVQFATANGTAIAGTDYVKTNGTLTFPDGKIKQQFSVIIKDNTVAQPDRSLKLRLFNPTSGATLDSTILPTNSVLTIVDDDFLPGHLSFSSPVYSVSEGVGSATVTVIRSSGSTGSLSVKCAASDGTAMNGLDYIGVTNTLSWDDSDVLPKTMTIPILDDSLVEGDETINLQLFNPVVGNDPNSLLNNSVFKTNSFTNATLTIIDDDFYGVPAFATPNFFVMENSGSATVTVVRQNGTAGAISVGYATINGTAVSPGNYTGVTNRLNFAPGETSKTFSVPIADNFVTNNNRTVNLVLFNPLPSSIATNDFQFALTNATLTIIDNESVHEPAGSVDVTYNLNTSMNDFVHALALQPDGKLLAGGDFTAVNKVVRNHIARLNVDGTLDDTFLSNLPGADGSIRSIVSELPIGTNANGHILIGGTFSKINDVNLNGIARLNLDGSLDSTFDPGSGADNPVYVVAETFLGTNRMILVAGNFTTVDGVSRNGVARLNYNGSVDLTFNPGSGINGTNGTIYALAVQADGKIIIGGDFSSFSNTPRSHLARLNIDGSLDASFFPDTGTNGSVRAITVQPDGKILIGGLFTSINGTNFNHIARLNPDGSIDAGFNPGVGANDSVLAITLDSQGRLLVGGEFTLASGVTRNRLTRLNADGTVDPTINFGAGANSFVSSIVIQPADDKIIFSGGFTQYDGYPKLHIARIYGGSITGNGAVEFTLANFQVNENGSNAVISVRRKGGTGSAVIGPVYINFATSDGTALAGTDYLSVTNTLTFPVGETFQSLMIPIIDNNFIDGDRTVNLTLSKLPGVDDVELGGQPTAVLTIINDDSAISFSSSIYRVAENSIAGNAIITVLRTGSKLGTVSVDYVTTTNGTATPVSDYGSVSNTLVFGSGETSKTFTIPIVNDTLIEGDETVGLQLSNAAGAILGSPNSATLTIVDDDSGPGMLAFSSPSYFVNEGSNAVITLIRTNGSAGPVSVNFATSAGTATDGLDYLGTNKTVSFADGEVTKDIVIPTLQDTLVEGNETVLLTLSNPQGGATIGGPTNVTLTIIDDDANFSFSSLAYFVSEGGGSVVIAVQRNSGTNGTVKVSYATTNAAPTNGVAVAGLDYITTTGTLTFAAGETLKTFNVPITEDTLVEGNESFFVYLSDPIGAQLGNPNMATVTIVDDDTGFSFSSPTYSIDEGGTNAIITVNRVNPNTGTVSVSYSTSDGTATAGSDYMATNGILTFLDGEASKTIAIPILEDTLVEGDETVFLTLTNATSGAVLLDTNNLPVSSLTSVLTIIDNDAGLRFSSPTYSVSESGVQATINVLRTTVTNTQVSIDFTTSNLTATAGLDYVATNGTLVFNPGETNKSFTVTIIDDTIIEGDEDIILILSNPTGGGVLVSPSVATLTIVDNDGSVIVPAGSALISESSPTPDGVIDPGETVSLLFAFRSIGGGNTSNMVATLLPTNGITSPSGPQTYGVLVQNGPSVSRLFSFTASGTNGQRITATFQLQDGSTNLGTNTFNFVLGKIAISFTNSALITINDATNTSGTNPPAKATPYPATINVSGFFGNASKVTASLNNLSHTYPDDIDILLVGPLGQKTLLMSDCGGSNSLSNVKLTFDDAAANNLSDTNQIVSGTYKPTDFEVGDPFPTPAPSAPYGASLSVFNGTSPNGTWSLYVVDDSRLDSGTIANGWSLSFVNSMPVPSSADVVVTMSASPNPATVSNALTYTITITNYGPSTATSVRSSYALPPGTTYVTNLDLLTGQVCDPNPVITSNANGVVVTLSHGDFPKDRGVALQVTVIPNNIGSFTNVVTVAGNETDPNPANNTVTNITPVNVASADLAVTMVDSPDPVLVGNNVTYIITVVNNGPSTALGVMLTNTLPPNVTVISNFTSQGTRSLASGTISCNLSDLDSGASATLTIVVQTTSAGTLTNTAHVASSVQDPFKSNNTAAVKVVAQVPQLLVSHSNSSLTLSWPAEANRYVLEVATNLNYPIFWDSNLPPATLSGSQYTFPVNVSNGSKFYRLELR